MAYVNSEVALEENAALAWARVVDTGILANYNANLFRPKYPTSGNRSYYDQCEAYITQRKGGNDAAEPYFTKGVSAADVKKALPDDCNNTIAESWYDRHNNNDPSDGIDFDSDFTWNNFIDVGKSNCSWRRLARLWQ